MGASNIVERVKELSTEEKLDLLYRLWDDIEQELAQRPASDAERRYLEDRLRDIEADGRPNRSWKEVRDDLLERP